MSDSRPPRDSTGKAALIDAATGLMLEEGYAAVTTRKVAAKAGVNQALVYYHFGTMDELFLAVFRRGAKASLDRLERAAKADDPLRALWQVSSEPRESALTIEFIALANHREAVRTELADYTRRFRRRQQEIIEQARRTVDIDASRGPSPAAVVVMTAALARILSMDGMLGITDGHAEMLALIEEYLGPASPAAPAAGSRSPTSAP